MVRRRVPDWSPEAEAIRSRVDALLGRLFDYEQIARNALGSDWTKLTPSQRNEFLSAFSQLTNRAFVAALTGPQVHQRFDSETMFGPTASVIVTAWGPGPAPPERRLEYRLARKQHRWAVYDVVLDGVSMVDGYRDQFTRLMRRGGIPEILDRMHRKLGQRADAE
jgi:phospholipid transport system substrate-binding protein